jgi:NAD(P)-dependent dehydrogenase (short-subunit alcohol dehydrogenase family)
LSGRNIAPYTISKGGVRQLTKAFAAEWARHGINVNGIGPGYFRTDMTETLWQDPSRREQTLSRIPMGRWGEPNELKGVALFLASRASDYMTGQIVYVDGGYLIS